MSDEIDVLRARCDQLQRRKRQEAEGYQQDVRLLQEKIKRVEQQLVRAAVTKAKEHDYIKAIKAYDRELEDVKKAMKKNPQWLD